MGQPIDITGKRCGALTVIRQVPRPSDAPHHRLIWLCRCDCGKEVVRIGKSLRQSAYSSCGCKTSELSREAHRKPPGESGLSALFASYRAGARDRGVAFEITRELFRELSSQPCLYCGDAPSKISVVRGNKMTDEGLENSAYTYNGIDRVDSDLGYTDDNCVPCCSTCNYAKKKMTAEEFIAWAHRLVTYQDTKLGETLEIEAEE